ncbi:glycoside hydrolase family 1 protein [Lacticaseibacillus sp. 866-1]|uniref:glycoside hydrolase family 1 protein n=1 Tax=Lacticaseibacillus sp. 866-1 TaxID=2799576 RepID=UPI00194124D5|nr:glycoside hydrolase family 1 protein [Lacticaseibacillus sp. 866-1]
MLDNKKYALSSSFLWGGASSASQFEGAANEDGKGATILDRKKGHGNLADFSIASDFYHHYKEDIHLLADLGLNSFRFSISWARIFPNGNDEVPNEKGLQFYENVIDECLKAGIEPVVTLYHFDEPLSILKQYGGWTSKRAIEDFKRYAALLFARFGQKVKYWLTFNECNFVLKAPNNFTGKEVSQHNPDFLTYKYQVFHNFNIAHFAVVAMYHAMKLPGKIGCMLAAVPTYPQTPNPLDVLKNQQKNQSSMYDFLDVLTQGAYPANLQALFSREKCWPEISLEETALMQNPLSKMDFISLSYYMTGLSSRNEQPFDPNASNAQNAAKRLINKELTISSFGWPQDPVGLRIILNELFHRYHLPLMIVENGLGAKDVLTEDGHVHDDYRIEYMKRHILEMEHAIVDDGVPVIGYLPWGIIDLVSSSEGFSKRYGVIYVNRTDHDLKDMRRIKKDSFYWYKHVIATHGQDLGDD